MKKWIAENAPWLAFLAMALLGGIVAHIRAYEKTGVEMTLKTHLRGLTIRITYAGTAGLMIYLLAEAAIGFGYKVSEPLAYVAAGIGGMFGAELFDFIFVTGKDFVRKRLGLQPSQPELPPVPHPPIKVDEPR